MAGGIAQALNLRLWPDWPTREGTAFVSSEDLLKQADASVLMISPTGPGIGLAQTLQSPIWRFVPVRTAGRMALMPRNIWGFAGPMSAVRLSHQLTDSMLDAAKGAAISGP